jgi:hypothetical protein
MYSWIDSKFASSSIPSLSGHHMSHLLCNSGRVIYVSQQCIKHIFDGSFVAFFPSLMSSPMTPIHIVGLLVLLSCKLMPFSLYRLGPLLTKVGDVPTSFFLIACLIADQSLSFFSSILPKDLNVLPILNMNIAVKTCSLKVDWKSQIPGMYYVLLAVVPVLEYQVGTTGTNSTSSGNSNPFAPPPMK